MCISKLLKLVIKNFFDRTTYFRLAPQPLKIGNAGALLNEYKLSSYQILNAKPEMLDEDLKLR
jgi:hypothetical protein